MVSTYHILEWGILKVSGFQVLPHLISSLRQLKGVDFLWPPDLATIKLILVG